jgi:hypothetical protein
MFSIEIKGKKYFIDKRNDETNEMFIERNFYISHINPITIEEFNKTLMEANMLVNTKYLGCKYNGELINKIIEKREEMKY